MSSKAGPIRQLSQSRGDLYRVDPAIIHIVEGFNARSFDDPANMEHVEELANSIAQIGVKNPLRVRWDATNSRIELVDGECRLRAVRLAVSRGAEIKSVPVISEDRYASPAELVLTQLTANGGRNFTPLEKAAVMKRLLAFGWSEAEIASKVGISRLRVTQLLELSAAPTEVTDMVAKGKVSASLAIETMRSTKGDGEEATKQLRAGIEQAARDGKSKATRKDVTKASAAAPILTLKDQRKRLMAILDAALGLDPDLEFLRRQYALFRKEAGIDSYETS